MTEEQWKAIRDRDAASDGLFCYAVKTSKTVCRPSCSARKPTPDTIIIFPTVEDAVRAGYHPCPRCRPDLPEWRGAKQELVRNAEQYIRAHYTDKFSLERIADAIYVNKIYLSKCFKEVTGSTLLAFHNRIRCEEACRLLTESDLSVDVVSSRVGYVTSSHFSRVFRSLYHCSPTEYRKNFLKNLK